jgi:hypothetical protein
MPTTLINETWASLTNWFGSTGSVASGLFNASAEGMRVCKTTLTSGDVWFRLILHNNSSVSHILVFSSNGSTGTCLGAAVQTNTTHITIGYIDRYDTFTSWVNDNDGTDADGGVAFSADIAVGITYERSTKKLRIWSGVTNAQPDSVTSWDGATAGSGQVYDFSAVGGQFVDKGNFCGLGADSTGTVQFGAFTAGDFSSAAAGVVGKIVSAFFAALNRAASW